MSHCLVDWSIHSIACYRESWTSAAQVLHGRVDSCTALHNFLLARLQTMGHVEFLSVRPFKSHQHPENFHGVQSYRMFESESLDCTNSELSSSFECSTLLLASLLLIQPKTDSEMKSGRRPLKTQIARYL